MSPLLALLAVGVFVVWLVAVLLLRAARRFPGVDALRERAVAAAVIATAGSLYFLAAFSVDVGGWWSQDASRTVARLCFTAIDLIPGLYWLYLYQRDFGGRGR